MSTGPIPESYWLREGALLAGEYPGTPDPVTTRKKLAKFLDAGIRTFVDLTERDEHLTKYAPVLRELAAERRLEAKHVRFGIRDLSVPRDRDLMTRILATIREEVAAGRLVYVHCWGGVGRTGTVIGCWLVDGGLTGEAAIARIADLRRARRRAGGRPRRRTTSAATYASGGQVHASAGRANGWRRRSHGLVSDVRRFGGGSHAQQEFACTFSARSLSRRPSRPRGR
ncbi:MAG: hypothetical protein H0X67_07475 [Acidobacteria bacterium]|nr:hypothetical protein [Acidobacteriota bacterium]